MMKEMDKKEFSRLSEENQTEMYAMAFQIVRKESYARQAVLSGVSKAYRNRNKFWLRKSFLCWINRYIRKEAISILQDCVRKEGFVDNLVFSMPKEDSLREKLNEAVRHLPEDCQNEVILYYYCGLNLKEICFVQNLSFKTAWVRLHRGKKLMQQEFAGKMLLITEGSGFK